MTKTCVECSDTFTAPKRGHGTMVRCRPCADTYKRANKARALRSTPGRWHSVRLGALRRGIEFELTIDELAGLLGLPCTYCGNPQNETGGGIDRLSSDSGYKIDNVSPCCWPCNNLRQRGDFTIDEMKQLGPLLGPMWLKHPPRGTRGRPRSDG